MSALSGRRRGGASTRAPRCTPRSRSGPARRRRSSSCSARPTTWPARASCSGRYREPHQARGALEAVKARWESILTAVQVRTPDPAFDLLLNRWLPYQVLSCRLWGRSALYQSGGAYGFRDQLQDVMALVYGAPGRRGRRSSGRRRGSSPRATCSTGGIRPPGAGSAPGSRTTSSGSPWSSAHYVTTTGDAAILDELVPFLEAPELAPAQEDRLWPARRSRPRSAPLYDHCVRALEHGTRLGPHGLPLMGTGDWNDGMNRVGAQGQRRERLARLVPAGDPRPVRPPGRGAGRRRARRDVPRRRPRRSAPPSKPAPGTATGIAAPTSTTAHRWARPRTTSARSTSWRRPGP